MTVKNITMKRRNATNTDWDVYYPQTKTDIVLMPDGTTSLTSKLSTQDITLSGLNTTLSGKIANTDLNPITTTGTSTAYTLTVVNANLNQWTVVFHVDCGDNATLSINGGTATALKKTSDNTNVKTGDIKANIPYQVVRVGSDFFIRNGGESGQPFFLKKCVHVYNKHFSTDSYRNIGKYFIEYTTTATKPILNMFNIQTLQMHKTYTDSMLVNDVVKLEYMTETLGVKGDYTDGQSTIVNMNNVTVDLNSFTDTEYSQTLFGYIRRSISKDNNYIYIVLNRKTDSTDPVVFKKYTTNGTLIFRKLINDTRYVNMIYDFMHSMDYNGISIYNYNGDLIKQYSFLAGEYYMFESPRTNSIVGNAFHAIDGKIFTTRYRDTSNRIFHIYEHY